MVLIRLGERDEARQALDRALELDPDDPKNRYTDQHFDQHFNRRTPAVEPTAGTAPGDLN